MWDLEYQRRDLCDINRFIKMINDELIFDEWEDEEDFDDVDDISTGGGDEDEGFEGEEE